MKFFFFGWPKYLFDWYKWPWFQGKFSVIFGGFPLYLVFTTGFVLLSVRLIKKTGKKGWIVLSGIPLAVSFIIIMLRLILK